MITTTTTTEEFDSDAIFNKLADCVNDEIHWNYKPDGHKEFWKWLEDEIAKVRKESFSEGRKVGLNEMDWAWCRDNRPDGEKIASLRMEYQNSPFSPQYQ